MGNLMKDVELKLICELMKNCRRSDRQLAKAVGVSQPTVSRTIKKLEEGRYLEYTAIPNLAKLDYEILAVVIGKSDNESYPEVAVQKAKDFIKNHPNIIFVSRGMGSSGDRLEVSVHKDYAGFTKFMQEVKTEWVGIMSVNAFLIDLKGNDVLRNLSFKYMADCLKERKTRSTTTLKH
jgi:DNA-binding Lrp family transcriptional regulator